MALAQKFLNCSTSTTPDQQIPVDRVVSFDKITILNELGDPSNVTYGIQFSLDTLSPVRTITLKYDNDTDRDASYSAIETAIAQTTV